ncbi:hypothetical protein BU52_28100 [Streptomyces toyocaensis]|uniref:LigA protein n=1 Tax=Streptomyces toyocaensis TaxID=55952 RepID=A0A081XJW5_STRTO|nr:hypothetical protein [Streptomyces toyocaensis]KES03838.1 hypothetical protein BU52_28100 [Streptomyces toyocaensis]
MPGSQHHDPFEERLAAALRDAGDGFDADPAALTAGGRVRGRRAQLLRRTAVLGGAAGIALVGVGGALLVPGGDSLGPDRSSAAAKPAASASATAAASFSGDDLLRTLKGLLPDGEFSQEAANGTRGDTPPFAHVVYDDGEGAAAIGVGFGRLEAGSREVREVTTCPDRALVEYDDCTSGRLPDGSLLMLYRGYEYPDRREDTKRWSAELVTADGQHVSLSEWNAAAEKGAPVSRAEPPLSLEELKRIVTAGAWRRVVDAMPEDRRPPATGAPDAPPPGAAGESIGAPLAGLLPKGLTVVDRGGQETEYAYLVIDDGKGRSLVQVNVQPDMSDVADQLYGEAETLPDGTLVATREGPGEKGGEGVLMWTADTMRPDGFRVVISAFNTGAQHQDATRATPALTVDRLKEIALSGKWEGLR